MLETPKAMTPTNGTESMDGTMDNQQETRLTERELAYMAGLFDGEGTIGIFKVEFKSKPNKTFRPIIQFVNTDLRLIAKFTNIAKALGCTYYMHTDNKSHRKTCYTVQITRFHMQKIWLETFIPFLVGKREQAELQLEFVKRRMELNANNASVKDRKGNLIKGFGHAKHDEIDEQYYLRVQGLNRGSSETTRTLQVH